MASYPQIRRLTQLQREGAKLYRPRLGPYRPGDSAVVELNGKFYKVGSDGREAPYTGPIIHDNDFERQVVDGALVP